MKWYVMGLVMLCWGANGWAALVCGSCARVLNPSKQAIIQLGCIEQHAFHEQCLQKILPAFEDKMRNLVCPIASCKGGGYVDKRTTYRIDQHGKQCIFTSGFLAALYEFIHKKWQSIPPIY